MGERLSAACKFFRISCLSHFCSLFAGGQEMKSRKKYRRYTFYLANPCYHSNNNNNDNKGSKNKEKEEKKKIRASLCKRREKNKTKTKLKFANQKTTAISS